MAVPTVTNVYPATGHVGGHGMIRILGGDFRRRGEAVRATDPDHLVTIVESDWSPSPYWGPTVQVRFGDAVAPQVLVVNHALIYARLPVSNADVIGPVDVTVQNLDDAGVPIPGEFAVALGAFTYRRVVLTGESMLVRIVRTFLRALKKQVLQNVTTSHIHTDYDAATGDTFNLTELQHLPSLVVIGPELEEGTEPEVEQYVDAFGYRVRMPQPKYGDLSFQIIGTSDRHVVLINLQSVLVTFFERNPYLYVDLDPADPSRGQVRFELVLARGGAPSINAGGDDSSLTTFGARAVIRQVPLSGLPGFDEEGTGGVGITRPVTAVIVDVDDL